MSESKTFYRVGEFVNTSCKIVETVATVENGIAKYRRYDHDRRKTVALASSLAWSPEEACNLYVAEKQQDVEELTERLEKAKKDLARAEGLYGRWVKDQEEERRQERARSERLARSNEERRLKEQEEDRRDEDRLAHRSGLYGDKT